MESWKQSGLVAVIAIAAIVIGGSLQAWSLEHGAPAVSKTSAVAGCPVDREICDFAVQAEAAVQRNDPSAIISPSSTWFADESSIGAAMLSQLQGGALPRVVDILCASTSANAPCSQFFVLVFDSLPQGQERSAPPHGYMAVLGFQRVSPMSILTGLSANEAALTPESSLCVYGQLLGGGCGEGLQITALAFDSSLVTRATKGAESRQPTPTPGSPVSGCPASPEACQFGQSAAAAIRASDSQALLSLSAATTLQCNKDSAPATQPLCQSGAEQTGYLTATPKSFGFVAGADFTTFIAASFESHDKVAVAAIGCPGAALGQMDCSQLVLITVAPLDDMGRIASGNNAPLVLVALRNEAGAFRIVAAQRTAADKPSFRGGPDTFGQFGVAWTGPVSFVPVRLPN